ncbi:hypothetical protein AAKU61_002563 [Undibacterium sp. GrIS 1.2]|uniref:hypothetical protein n=1 Tax=Undibacterium sp. GrIS 1.2 TaxID=3143933 RepID=UPI0033947CB3
MSEDEKIAIKEFVSVLKDRKWHNLYELHTTYNLSPILIFSSMVFLLEQNIIVRDGKFVCLSENLDNEKLSLLNLISKTKRPVTLCTYTRNFLPRWQHRV